NTGASVTFSVIATGEEPLSFQWYFGTNAIPRATNASLLIANAEPGLGGSYRVVVQTGSGAFTSAVATLTIVSPPVITLQPQSQTALPGEQTTFLVEATGTVPM